MAHKKQKKQELIKKVVIDPPAGSPMDKFHQAMRKIVSVPKKSLKDK